MNKLKFLLSILMAVLIAFAAQRAYYTKTDMVSGIYSDIIFTRLAVESQEYTRQIEYGVKNGKSLENFYNIESVLSGVRRCFSYTNGAYIFSADRRLLYSLSDSGTAVTRFSVADFSDGRVYSVYDDAPGQRYILTLPIFGRGNEVCGYMVLDISRSAVDNKLEDYRSEYKLQSLVTGTLCWLAGSIILIHMCRSRERLMRRGTAVIAGTVCAQVAIDGGLSVYKFSVTIDSLIQQSVSKITMSLQNDLDTVNEKGVALSKIYDLNSWLMENYKDIPFIDNLIYDRDYRITAVVSESYINERIWRFSVSLIAVLMLCLAAGAALVLIVTAAGRAAELLRRKMKNDHRGSTMPAESLPEKELVSDTHAGK